MERYIKSTHIIAQVAHITCKKDHHEILSLTVSGRLSKGYEKLLSLFVKQWKGKKISISKNAVNIKLECDPLDQTKCTLLIKFQEEVSR